MRFLLAAAPNLGLALTPQQCDQFAEYSRELLAWNQRLNLTAIRTPEEVELKHFVDSLTLFSICAFVPEATPKLETRDTSAAPPPTTGIFDRSEFKLVLPTTARLIDVGAGAGFPGIPLKIIIPGLHLVLVESIRKKATFLEHIINVLGFQNVDVVAARAEELGHDPRYRASCDLAVARGIAKMPALTELALPFCRPGGFFVAYKGSGAQTEAQAARRAIAVLGGELVGLAEIKPLPNLERRVLVAVRKIRHTPPAYPRRAGLPTKSPL